MTLIYVLAGILIAITVFIWWRYTSVGRGARQRDEKLLTAIDLIAQRLTNGELVTAQEIADLAVKPQYRPMLYAMLKHFERLNLFPAELLTRTAEGEGALAHWMMHPNELQDAPSEMQLVEEVQRLQDGKPVTYLVFRYRMAPGHWAEKDGWLLGLAGPFQETQETQDPYSGEATAFSRCGDVEGKIAPGELVDWWLGMLKARGV